MDLPAWISIASDAVIAGARMVTPVKYETMIVDSPTESRQGGLYQLPLGHQVATASSATARAPLQRVSDRKFAKSPKRPSVARLDAQLFVVATCDTLAVRNDVTPPVSKGIALQALASFLRSHPRERGTLQILLAAEADHAHAA